MTVNTTEYLINEILSSPNAPTLISRVSDILAEERERRTAFYNEITEQEKAEFINGEVIIHSPVKKAHNEISGNIYKIISSYVIENDLGFVGIEKILIQCTRNDYEPDLCFFNKVTSSKFKADQALFPIPNLIVEVLSKGTEKRDRGIKFEDYQNHGVQEYWIVDPVSNTIEQYILTSEKEYELKLKSSSGELESVAIANLILPIKTMFDTQLTHQFVKDIYSKE